MRVHIAGWNRPAMTPAGLLRLEDLSAGKWLSPRGRYRSWHRPCVTSDRVPRLARSNFRVGQELSAAIEHLNQDLDLISRPGAS